MWPIVFVVLLAGCGMLPDPDRPDATRPEPTRTPPFMVMTEAQWTAKVLTAGDAILSHMDSPVLAHSVETVQTCSYGYTPSGAGFEVVATWTVDQPVPGRIEMLAQVQASWLGHYAIGVDRGLLTGREHRTGLHARITATRDDEPVMVDVGSPCNPVSARGEAPQDKMTSRCAATTTAPVCAQSPSAYPQSSHGTSEDARAGSKRDVEPSPRG